MLIHTDLETIPRHRSPAVFLYRSHRGTRMAQDVEWAGVPFMAMFHHDGHFFRTPGLYGFVRNLCGVRTLLLIDQSDNIATATESHRLWGELVRLGCNELHINLKATEKIDRLILKAHIVKRCEPLLNVLENHAAPYDEASVRRRA